MLILELLVLLIACLASLVGIWSSPKRNKAVVAIATVIAVTGLVAAATLTVLKSRDAWRKAVEAESKRETADKDFSDYRRSAEAQLAGLRSDNTDLRNRIVENQQKADEQSELTLKGLEELKIKGGAVVTRLLTKDHVAESVSLIFDLSKMPSNGEDSEQKEKVFPLVGTHGLSASKLLIDTWITKRLRQRVTIVPGKLGLLVEMTEGPKYQLSSGGTVMPLQPTEGTSDEGGITVNNVDYAIDDKFRKTVTEKPHFWNDSLNENVAFGVNFLGDAEAKKRPVLAMSDVLRALSKGTTIGLLQIWFDEQPTPQHLKQMEQLWRKYVNVYFKLYLSDRGFVQPQKKDEEEDTQWNDMRPHMFVPIQFDQFVLRDGIVTVNLTVSGEPQLFFQEESPF